MNKKKKRIASDNGTYRNTSSVPSRAVSLGRHPRLLFHPPPISHTDGPPRDLNDSSIRPRGRVCKMQFRGEMHLDATAAVRGGQGRRLRKQMGCKVGSGGTRRLRRERKRRGSRDRDEGKREAIVSGAHTGVGLDSFIGARSTARSERKRGRKRDR